MIYYDRYTDVPQGIFSVPILGGDERLVLENAFSPEPLPDGSLLIVRLNAEGRYQLHRFWPGTGRIQALPIRMSQSFYSARVRAFPDGKMAVAWGQTIGQTASPPGFYVIDLSSGSRIGQAIGLARSRGSGWRQELCGFAGWQVDHGLCTFRRARQDLSFSGERPRGADRVAYRDRYGLVPGSWSRREFLRQHGGPARGCRPLFAGRKPDRKARDAFRRFPDITTMTVLPDGRAVLPVRASSEVRLMVVQKGKDPAPLVNTTEETAAPVTACGSREIAFMIGPDPHETIAFAEPASGRMVRTIAPGKGPVDSISCSPDGKTVYFVARGVVWSTPSSGPPAGSGARKIRAGDSVVADPSGRRLIVQAQESLRLHRFSVPLDGSPEREIPADGSSPVAPLPLSSNALQADGRLLTSLLPHDSWFNPPGSDRHRVRPHYAHSER